MSNQLYKEGQDYTQVDLAEIRKTLKERAPLETFGFEEISEGEHWVSISSPEFTAICPFSDWPDFGSVTIEYVPSDQCLELKSFKLYINAFRDLKIFHESVTEVIFADFLKWCSPRRLKLWWI
ncbi:preQ(1) synthase [Candidatus Peregrinibacteria bacterium]|nr:MAG: preQ(1) synthase [Candidatus Peregrinibacteria bacterium]